MLVITEPDGSLRLRPFRVVADESIGLFANLGDDGSLVDELLAFLRKEPGAPVVADAIAGGCAISAVNLAEVLSTLADRGADPTAVAVELTDLGLLDGAMAVQPFTTADAIETARLRPFTHSAGLALGDRACLALAQRLSTAALTADQAWTGLTLGVDVRAIRDPAQ